MIVGTETMDELGATTTLVDGTGAITTVGT
jgi:hypothetical protein